MTAICVGHIRVRDADAWDQYRARVGATLSAHGGELLFRGLQKDVLSGQSLGERVVAIRFADLEAARRWHGSPEYQALIALRERGAEVTLELFEE